MTQDMAVAIGWLEQHPPAYAVVVVIGLVLVAWLANWMTKHILLRGLRRLLSAVVVANDLELTPLRVVSRLSNVVPALVLMLGIRAVPALPAALVPWSRTCRAPSSC
ncbi:hypothetical protein [Thauera humireducens]|uniref:hypothetical protein n=1 Tax=Thauera humireducens TaxID=1134435 RepID=UPI00311EF4A1